MVKVDWVDFFGECLEVGHFVYSHRHNANVEVLALYDDVARVGENSIHRYRIVVQGCGDSTMGKTFSPCRLTRKGA